MISRAALLIASLASWSAAAPPAEELLRSGFSDAQAAYSAELMVTRYGGKGPLAKKVRVSFSPPAYYRREILAFDGSLERLIVSDGKEERSYDPRRRVVRESEALDPLYKRFGPEEEVERLMANYDASVGEGPQVAGRPTWFLELRPKAPGGGKRRFWLDRDGGLILRSENFHPEGSLASSMRVDRISRGRALRPEEFRLELPAGVKKAERLKPDYLEIEEARGASGMEARVPAWLPSGYVFESLDVIRRGRKAIIHARFSDGVEVLSLFQCPPRVRLGFGGRPRRRVKIGSLRGTATWTEEGNVLSWSSGGQRFVLVAPLEDETLRRVAASLP